MIPVGAGEGGFRPTELRAVPPGESRPAVLRWTGPAVRRQDGQGQAASVMHPVAAGSS